jgi:hypothetical protein
MALYAWNKTDKRITFSTMSRKELKILFLQDIPDDRTKERKETSTQ